MNQANSNTSPKTQKQSFIDSLRRFASIGGNDLWDPIYARLGYRACRGEMLLAGALAEYLDVPTIPDETPGINWYQDLPIHLADAFVAFRTLDSWTGLKQKYYIETGNDIPDLVDVHIGGLARQLVTGEIARLATVLTGERWLLNNLESYFGAQQHCINQAWRKFVRVGYRELMPRIKKERHRGNSGRFGQTCLMTWACAGRVMFTFERGEFSVTYVADDSDMHGERSGPNATSSPYAECVSMISDVVAHWSLDKMTRCDEVGL